MGKSSLSLNKRQQQAMETRLHVYNTALEIFRERDYDSVRVPELCEAAGVSIGTFYNYFQSKEELIMTAYQKLDDYIEAAFELDSYDSCLDAINALLDIQTKRSHDRGPFIYMQIMRVQLKTGGKHVIEDGRAMNRYMLEAVRRGVETGELNTKLNPEEIAATILRISRGVLFDWSMRRADYDPNQLIKKDVAHYLQHIREDG